MVPLLRLIIVHPDRETPHLIEGTEAIVGSGAECSIRLGHPAVSRRHARLSHEDGDGWMLEDLGSSNGTFYADRRVTRPIRVETPVHVGFGPVSARLEALEPDDAEPAVMVGSARAVAKASGRTETTIQSASVQRLVTEVLPRWIDALEAELDVATLAQRIGGSLFEVLPVRTIEVLRLRAGHDTGTIFRASASGTDDGSADDVSDDAGPREAAVTVEGRETRFDVWFPHRLQARAYRAVVESASRFVDLARPGGAKPVPATATTPPPLPDPPSVEPAFRALYAEAAKVATGDISVLITGESGTGKEVLARYLHHGSPRRDAPFEALNCAALAKDLLESELFGIEEGVATGVKARAGCFERADGGTLFLDEIGDMAPETQASILRVLQEGEVFRLGGRTGRSANVRVIAATNRDIEALLASETFRADLFHRIADWRVELPPLRQRKADIINLAAYFLAQSARKRGLAQVGISKRAAAILECCPWPGNVRQLEREIARAVLFLEPGELLQSHHLQQSIRDAPRAAAHTDGTLRERLDAAERAIVAEVLRRHDGDVRAVAKILDIGRSTLYRRIKAWGLDADDE